MPKKYCSTEHIYFFKSNGAKEKWCRHQELNSGPDDYKSNGLPLNPTNTANNEDYYWTTGNFLIDSVYHRTTK